MQGKYDEAYSAYYKATWNAAWRDAGYFGVAQIDSIRKIGMPLWNMSTWPLSTIGITIKHAS